jgi:SAM-dependent methyltransferase
MNILEKTKTPAQAIFTYEPKRGGVFCDEYKVAPWPNLIFRRQALLDLLEQITLHTATPKYLEFGYGTGVFLYEFYQRGYDVTGYDLNDNAPADDIFNADKHRVNIIKSLDEIQKDSYDVIGAYEVLEHIEDDAAMLGQWSAYLKKGGYALFTVPARMKYWCAVDEHAGHVRRYEKQELYDLLTGNGFEVLSLVNAGYPFNNLISLVSNVVIHKKYAEEKQQMDLQSRTVNSGFERSREFKLKKFVPFGIMQRLTSVSRSFYNGDSGRVYAVVAKKL